MADWYVSSANYAAVSVWAATTAYTVGQFVRPLTNPGQVFRQYVFRCTVAGTSGAAEPSWAVDGDGSTLTSGGATFMNVTGRSAHGWSAAAGTLYCILGNQVTRLAAGDRVFLASDHNEATGNGSTINAQYNVLLGGAGGFGLVQFISVNRAGSVPPVAADMLPGAYIPVNALIAFDCASEAYFEGITFESNHANGMLMSSNSAKRTHYKNCLLKIVNTGATAQFYATTQMRIVFDNTQVQCGNTGQRISTSLAELLWLNTASPIAGATIPGTLFYGGINAAFLNLTARGVDFSAVTGTLVAGNTASSTAILKALFDSCRIASGVTRYNLSGSLQAADEVELVNCYDGTNTLNERYTAAGAVSADRSTTLSGGATDDIGAYSLKLVSSSRADKSVLPLESFWLDAGNTAIGTSKTATVEVISSGTLNDNDISLLLEYMGTSGSPIASFASSLPAVVATGTALPTSSVTWNSPPATPVKQKMQVTFTPQRAGRVRGLVRLGKASATVWVNPQIAIT